MFHKEWAQEASQKGVSEKKKSALCITVDFISFNAGVTLKILEQILVYRCYRSEKEGGLGCGQVPGDHPLRQIRLLLCVEVVSLRVVFL